jgi:hypothetical protein
MSARIVALCVLLGWALPAWAHTPPPTEDVTVTADKSRNATHNFTKAFAAPTQLSGKIARWQRRLCPLTLGEKPNTAAFITQHVKYVGLAVHAPVNTDASCTPNIEIVFTTTPQDLLDNVRKSEGVLLGYASTSTQLDKLAQVTRPVQAWYTTETMDCNGMRAIDTGAVSNASGDRQFSPPSYAHCGSRIVDGLVTGFNHILIVIDTTKLAGQEVVPLADYIAMLALTQLNSLDTCQTQPSIVNIMATGCEHSETALTEFDLAYLQGLYRMSAGRKVHMQRNEIGDTMKDRLEGEK